MQLKRLLALAGLTVAMAPMIATVTPAGFSTHNERNDVSVTHQICRLISDLLIAETRCFNQSVTGQTVLLLQGFQKSRSGLLSRSSDLINTRHFGSARILFFAERSSLKRQW